MSMNTIRVKTGNLYKYRMFDMVEGRHITQLLIYLWEVPDKYYGAYGDSDFLFYNVTNGNKQHFPNYRTADMIEKGYLQNV